MSLHSMPSNHCSNGVAGSALCAFNMTAVNTSFNGPLKYQTGANSVWSPVTQPLDHYRCNYNDSDIVQTSLNANKYQQVHAKIMPIDDAPVYKLDYER